jgi:sec-independent protein translocase protein TatA
MGISVTKLLIILAVVVVLFGTQRLRNVGSDLGAAIKNFRGALKEGEEDTSVENKGEIPDGEEKPVKDEKPDSHA